MTSRKKAKSVDSQVYSTTEWARRIHQECLDVLQVLVRDYGFQITEAMHETAYVHFTVRNTSTFIEISWDPRDGLAYWIGPIEKGSVPKLSVFPDWKQSSSRYEIETIAAVKTDSILPTIQGKNNTTLESLTNAITYLVENAADLLQGDWSCREELEVHVRKNIGS